MPLITIFSAPKPFTNPHIATIQRNAIQSWLCLGSEVEVILMGDESGLAETAAEFGASHLPEVARNTQGTPLVSSLFDLARRNSSAPLLAYVNADILLLPDFLQVARQVRAQVERFLIVGQRWDLDVCQPLDFSPGWDQRLTEMVRATGQRHPPAGSDYFVYPRECFQHVPSFAIGRAGWDNWMIYAARQQGWPVVDASQSICLIHQNHDYSHLPGGQPHYRLPETGENVRLAGGKRHMFSLLDANRQLVNGRLQSTRTSWKKFWRDVEVFPLVSLHSQFMGQLFYALFHPVKAYREVRSWARQVLLKRHET